MPHPVEQERGFRVFTVPEAATMLFSNGVLFEDLKGAAVNFQKNLMRVRVRCEGVTTNSAQTMYLCVKSVQACSFFHRPGMQQWQHQ